MAVGNAEPVHQELIEIYTDRYIGYYTCLYESPGLHLQMRKVIFRYKGAHEEAKIAPGARCHNVIQYRVSLLLPIL